MVSKVKAGIFEANSSWKLMLGLVISAHFIHSVCLVLSIVADTTAKKAIKNKNCQAYTLLKVSGIVINHYRVIYNNIAFSFSTAI